MYANYNSRHSDIKKSFKDLLEDCQEFPQLIRYIDVNLQAIIKLPDLVPFDSTTLQVTRMLSREIGNAYDVLGVKSTIDPNILKKK